MLLQMIGHIICQMDILNFSAFNNKLAVILRYSIWQLGTNSVAWCVHQDFEAVIQFSTYRFNFFKRWLQFEVTPDIFFRCSNAYHHRKHRIYLSVYSNQCNEINSQLKHSAKINMILANILLQKGQHIHTLVRSVLLGHQSIVMFPNTSILWILYLVSSPEWETRKI
jgi:hypothetical protein